MNVPHTESLTFYVEFFNPKDPSLTEFIVLENGHIATKNEGYKFTIDAPLPNGRPVDFTLNNNNTFRLYLNSYLKDRNSIKIYLNRNPFNGEYSGPITFVSSNGNRNPNYSAECDKENYEGPDKQAEFKKENSDETKVPVKKPSSKDEGLSGTGKKSQVAYVDTNLLWKFQTPKSVAIQKSGPKIAVLNEELLNARIIPTKGMKQLIDRLNPGLAGQERTSAGTTFNLPAFREPDKIQVKSMQLQIQKDTSKDETQNELIAVKTKNFSNMLKILRNLNAKGEYMELLNKSENLLNKIVFNLSKIKFKRYHAVMISTEIEKMTNYLFKLAAQNTLPKTNSNYISSFNKYIEDIINPYYYTKAGNPQASMTPSSSTSGVMAAKHKFIFPGLNSFYKSTSDYVFSIHVFIRVPQKSGGFEYIDSMKRYWVYVLDPFQYDNLNDLLIDMDENKKNGLSAASLNKIISKEDLDGTGSQCGDLASITTKPFDFGKSYHFIVVSDITNEIVIHDYIENTSNNIPKRSNDKNILELYGVGLYQEPNKK